MVNRLAHGHLTLITIASILIAYGISQILPSNAETLQHVLKSKYEIIDLGGNTPGVWPAWNMTSGQALKVEIISLDKISQDKINTIKNAVLSEDTIGSGMDTASSGSVFYVGWKGALDEASKRHTFLLVPDKFKLVDADNYNDISIILTDVQDVEGYSGYTKLAEGDNVIQKATITIYNANDLSSENLGTITRHEMGHALGLGHSDDPDDLMYALVKDPSFISSCDIDEVVSIYDAERSGNFECER